MAALDDSLVLLVGAAATGGGALTGWLSARATNRKTKAETDSIIVSAAHQAVGMVQSRLDDMVEQHRRCETDMAELRQWVRILERTMRTAGVELPARGDMNGGLL